MQVIQIEEKCKLYQQAVELRYSLFFKVHGLPKAIVFDEHESYSTHIAMSNKAELIAYGRLSKIGSSNFIISQVVVSPSYQNKGYGSQVLIELMRIAAENQAKEITLSARVTAVKLYERLGFVKLGETYKSQSTGVPHIKMVYRENT